MKPRVDKDHEHYCHKDKGHYSFRGYLFALVLWDILGHALAYDKRNDVQDDCEEQGYTYRGSLIVIDWYDDASDDAGDDAMYCSRVVNPLKYVQDCLLL